MALCRTPVVPYSTRPPSPAHQLQVLQGVPSLGWVCRLVDQPQLPSVQPAVITHFAFCGHTGQGLLPVPFRGLAGATASLLVDGASSQPSCLGVILSATAAGTPKGRACPLCSQLRDLATETVCVLLCVVTSHYPSDPRIRVTLECYLSRLGLHARYGAGVTL